MYSCEVYLKSKNLDQNHTGTGVSTNEAFAFTFFLLNLIEIAKMSTMECHLAVSSPMNHINGLLNHTFLLNRFYGEDFEWYYHNLNQINGFVQNGTDSNGISQTRMHANPILSSMSF